MVFLGRGGITEGVLARTDEALEAHELVRVRFGDGFEDSARDGAASLARAVDAAVAGVLGRTVLLYRPRDEDPEIRLPEADRSPADPGESPD